MTKKRKVKLNQKLAASVPGYTDNCTQSDPCTVVSKSLQTTPAESISSSRSSWR